MWKKTWREPCRLFNIQVLRVISEKTAMYIDYKVPGGKLGYVNIEPVKEGRRKYKFTSQTGRECYSFKFADAIGAMHGNINMSGSISVHHIRPYQCVGGKDNCPVVIRQVYNNGSILDLSIIVIVKGSMLGGQDKCFSFSPFCGIYPKNDQVFWYGAYCRNGKVVVCFMFGEKLLYKAVINDTEAVIEDDNIIYNRIKLQNGVGSVLKDMLFG